MASRRRLIIRGKEKEEKEKRKQNQKVATESTPFGRCFGALFLKVTGKFGKLCYGRVEGLVRVVVVVDEEGDTWKVTRRGLEGASLSKLACGRTCRANRLCLPQQLRVVPDARGRSLKGSRF